VLRDPDFGPSRVLYGSDFPITHIRGRCVGLGDSFLWIAPSNCDLTAKYAPGGVIQTALVGVEALRALKLACDNVGLDRDDVQKIMCGNGERLFGIPPDDTDTALGRQQSPRDSASVAYYTAYVVLVGIAVGAFLRSRPR
jgi:hypothetical protein